MAKYGKVFVSATDSEDKVKAGVVISIGEVNESKAMEDDDDLESAETGYTKRKPGLKTVDDVSLLIRHNSSDPGVAILDASYENNTTVFFEIRYPDAAKTNMSCECHVSGRGLNAQETSTTRIERNYTISPIGSLVEGAWTE